jgi:hypothetical protein
MAKVRKVQPKTGRLVWNHSTHLPGLIPILSRLAGQPGIKTVIPGRLARVRGRPSPLKIKVTVPISGGYKLQARAQSSVQEVFVTTDLNAEALQTTVDRLQDSA